MPPKNQKRQTMDNVPEKRFDIQIIAHSVLQKQYTQIRGLPPSQDGQRRSRRESPTSFLFRLQQQKGDRRINHLQLQSEVLHG